VTDDEILDLLASNGDLAPVALCPEVRAWQARALIPLWERLEAVAGREVEPPFWAFAWPGGQALARHVLDHPDLVRGRSVLDLGSGNGIAAIASVLSGASRSVANDIDAASLSATRLNAAAGSLEVQCLERDLLALPPDTSSYEVILAGDMFYERRLAERALRWLREAASKGALVLAGDPGRTYSPGQGVEEVSSHDVPVSLEVERETPLRARVLRIL